MEANTLIPEKFVNAFGHAFFKKDDEFACAPLLAGGGADWESWTIVEESPEADRAHVQRMLRDLGFDLNVVENIIARIEWY